MRKPPRGKGKTGSVTVLPAGRQRAAEKIAATDLAWLRYVLDSPMVENILTELGDTHSLIGRPRKYEDWTLTLMFLLTGHMPARRVQGSFLPEPVVWAQIERAYAAAYPGAGPLQRPTRSAYQYFVSKHLAPKTGLVAEVMRARAVIIVGAMGLLDPLAPYSPTRPERRMTVIGDGTVFSSPITLRRGEKLTIRHQAIGADWFTEAGDDTHPVCGMKYVSLAVRGDDLTTRRVILDVQRQPAKGEGGEMGLGLELVLRLAGHESVRIDVLAWDGAIRGIHNHTLMRHGILPVHPVRKDDQPRPLEHLTGCDCQMPHRLYSHQTAICEHTIDEDGQAAYVPCRITQTRRVGRAGKYRWYQEILLSCGRSHRLRLDMTTEHGGQHRAEWLQPLNPAAGNYKTVYGRRADIESRHRELDDALPIHGRMSHYIPAHQDLWVIANTMMENERAYAEWHAQQTQQQAA